ncbi:MAG: hypothetical protein Q8N99_08500 [Nanoarchaeota archaeon]|nr:hypothetical protein [Nanoarchaeota archaeon]
MEKKTFAYSLSVLVLVIILISLFYIRFTGYAIKEPEKKVTLYFYDENTNCSLDGFLFIGETLIGKAENGIYNLSYRDYTEKFLNNTNKNITLFGKLGKCFNKDSDYYFDRSWKNIAIDESYFRSDSEFLFKTKLKIHNPIKREMLGFIQKDNAKYYLNNIILNNITFNDLSTINKHLDNNTKYVIDWGIDKENYWQSPYETFTRRSGDCEDFSTALLSLFLAYDENIKCYNVIFSTHITTFCYISGNYIYYDQKDKEIKRLIKDKTDTLRIKSELILFNKEYFDYYGLKNNSRAYYAFDDNEYFEFNDEQDFIDWQYSLISKERKINIYNKLEEEVKKIEKTVSEDEYTELRTMKLAGVAPTLKGFILDNLYLFIASLITLLLLITLVIRIIRK